MNKRPVIILQRHKIVVYNVKNYYASVPLQFTPQNRALTQDQLDQYFNIKQFF